MLTGLKIKKQKRWFCDIPFTIYSITIFLTDRNQNRLIFSLTQDDVEKKRDYFCLQSFMFWCHNHPGSRARGRVPLGSWDIRIHMVISNHQQLQTSNNADIFLAC